MKFTIKIEVPDDQRKAVAWCLGNKGRASRLELQGYCRGVLDANLTTIQDKYYCDPDVRRKRARKLNNLGPDLRTPVARIGGQQ